ncbi:hypothetical protein R1sor_019433 [Riccia sorocarpa]|uniref:Uncharacterized protein n=1 Tax=Riccia sorocarpa TaxID=122646 RepID=A0ABD3IGN9_9MARC
MDPTAIPVEDAVSGQQQEKESRFPDAECRKRAEQKKSKQKEVAGLSVLNTQGSQDSGEESGTEESNFWQQLTEQKTTRAGTSSRARTTRKKKAQSAERITIKEIQEEPKDDAEMETVERSENSESPSQWQGMDVESRKFRLVPRKSTPPSSSTRKDEKNPFWSNMSVLSQRNKSVSLGHMVPFSGEVAAPDIQGRKPKKKEGVPGSVSSGGIRSKGGTENSEGKGLESTRGEKAAEKRRALGEMDHNGCRLNAYREAQEDSATIFDRDRKKRDEGLSQVLESGTGGQGRMAWAKIKDGDSWYGLMSVHAPNKRRGRIAFWQQIASRS